MNVFTITDTDNNFESIKTSNILQTKDFILYQDAISVTHQVTKKVKIKFQN
jgi:hypothetical protein